MFNFWKKLAAPKRSTLKYEALSSGTVASDATPSAYDPYVGRDANMLILPERESSCSYINLGLNDEVASTIPEGFQSTNEDENKGAQTQGSYLSELADAFEGYDWGVLNTTAVSEVEEEMAWPDEQKKCFPIDPFTCDLPASEMVHHTGTSNYVAVESMANTWSNAETPVSIDSVFKPEAPRYDLLLNAEGAWAK